VGEDKLAVPRRLEAGLKDPLVGLGADGNIKEGRGGLAGTPEIRRFRDQTPDLVPCHLKAGRLQEAGQLLQVVPAHVGPARFCGQGLEKMLDGDEALPVQYQAEFVRPVAQNIIKQLNNAVQLDLAFFGHNEIPS
jgi:hypothetical protein